MSKTTNDKGMYTATFRGVGNPDYNQYADVAPTKKVKADTLEGISKLARKYITDYDLGSGNFMPTNIYQDGSIVAHVSYNGRVWEGTTAKVNAKCLYDTTYGVRL